MNAAQADEDARLDVDVSGHKSLFYSRDDVI
jgi:hypothetical protein